MAKQNSIYSIFIASPGDVADERQVVHDLCRKLNSDPLVKGLHIQLESFGWELAMPQAGDPQEIINQLVDECDLLICLFHRRFGSSTTDQPSGTLEEFLNAYEKWKNNQKPQIFLYFKDAVIRSKKEREDAQFIKVLDFKEQVANDRLVLYKEFNETADFKKGLERRFE